MDVVIAERLLEGECDLVSAYEYTIQFAKQRRLGSMQLGRLHQLQREHRNHASALQSTDLLSTARSDPRGSLVVARALVRFATPRGWTAVLETLAEQERRWYGELMPLWAAEQTSSHGTLLRAMIVSSRRAVDWLAFGGRVSAPSRP